MSGQKLPATIHFSKYPWVWIKCISYQLPSIFPRNLLPKYIYLSPISYQLPTYFEECIDFGRKSLARAKATSYHPFFKVTQHLDQLLGQQLPATILFQEDSFTKINFSNSSYQLPTSFEGHFHF